MRKPSPASRIVAERAGARAAARKLWAGLIRYNRKTAGPFRYTRAVLTVRGASRHFYLKRLDPT